LHVAAISLAVFERERSRGLDLEKQMQALKEENASLNMLYKKTHEIVQKII